MRRKQEIPPPTPITKEAYQQCLDQVQPQLNTLVTAYQQYCDAAEQYNQVVRAALTNDHWWHFVYFRDVAEAAAGVGVSSPPTERQLQRIGINLLNRVSTRNYYNAPEL